MTRIRIAVPRPPSERPALRDTPPKCGPERVETGVYLLDSTVALGFAHIDQVSLLRDHYGPRLYVTENVVLEWRYHFQASPAAVPVGASDEERKAHQQRVRVRLAARKLIPIQQSAKPLAIEVPLLDEDHDSIEELRKDLALLPTPHDYDENSRADRGECASVHYGKKLRAGRVEPLVVLLCTDDVKARKLATNHGLVRRSTADVLLEMVYAGTLEPAEAHAHYVKAMEVARPGAADQHHGVEFFEPR